MAQDSVLDNDVAHAGAVVQRSNALGWESRSSDELMEIVRRGLQGGDTFDAAQREMERRAAENLRREDASAAAGARRIRKERVLLAAFATLALAAALAVVIVYL